MTDNNPENEQWTLRWGKNVEYIPYPFKSRDDFTQKTVIFIVILILGIWLLTLPDLIAQIFGALTSGSVLVCYSLSYYETHLYDKKQRHRLR